MMNPICLFSKLSIFSVWVRVNVGKNSWQKQIRRKKFHIFTKGSISYVCYVKGKNILKIHGSEFEYCFILEYSKTPWDTAPWHTIFAVTLFWFRGKNFPDTLFFKFFTNLKVHYFQKCVKTLFNLRFLSQRGFISHKLM